MLFQTFMILNTKEDVCNQTIDGKAIDFHSWKKILCKSIGGVNCLVTNILQNIFVCVQQKNLIQVWNNMRVSK